MVLVRVHLPRIDARGVEHAEVSTYALRRDISGTLKVQFAAMHGPSTSPGE